MILKNFTKEQINGYSDEDLFIDEVVIPLFEAALEAEGAKKRGPVVVLPWGKDKRREGEHGIDVLIGFVDWFGKIVHKGVLVKVENITMGTGSSKSSSLVNIGNQIEVAWTADFTSPIDHKSARVNDLIVITNKTIYQEALDYLLRINREKYRGLECWDCPKIESLVVKFYMGDKRV